MWSRVLLLWCCAAAVGVFPADGGAPEEGRDMDQTREKTSSEREKGEDRTLPKQESLLKDAGKQAPVQDAAGEANGSVGDQQTSEPLKDEEDNQENIMTQLLGDYDKVKTISSGSDCVCRCIVRPIERSACDRIRDNGSASSVQNFYTVETVTKGTDCKKCECLAPPSAVNPCEGEYRFKKLQEAGREDVKLSTILDLLEGSMYGMDLLKLHSVTTKLLTRMDNMEKALSRYPVERGKEKEKDKRAQQRQDKKKKMADGERPGQKNGAAVFANKQKNYEERYVGGPLKKNQQPTRNNTGNQNPVKDKKELQSSVKEKNNMVVRGVTFYMAEGGSKEEEKEQKRGRGDGGAATSGVSSSVDLSISGQPPATTTALIQRLQPFTDAAQTTATKGPTGKKSLMTTSPQMTSTRTMAVTPLASTTAKPTTRLTSAPPTPATEPTTTTTTTTQTTTTEASTTKATTTASTSTQTLSPTYAPPFAQPNTPPVTASSTSGVRSRLSWTENPADKPKTTKKPGVCKDTVASISEPVQQHSYGHGYGAWMRDARGHGNVIYLTNGHYGSNLLEFRDMDNFRSAQASNSYKLPYSFTGTGHVVYNGAFYYNRAFSRDIIRYDLRHRYVAAWTTLHDAILEEQVHKTHTEVEFAVDESGLWLLYPALDTEGFHQEVILLTQLHPRDLQPIRSFRTGMRRGLYGNSFLVCGVLYAVNSMERLHANVTYAFDTHTLTHTVPKLAFTNMHALTSQLSYCPLDKKLYGWDNGHQMLYDVIFAY